jgi:hypothetical protein
VYNIFEGGRIMRKYFVGSLLVVCLLFGTAGCAVTTTGHATWEVYGGVRTSQGEEPGKVEVESSVVDTVVGSLVEDK